MAFTKIVKTVLKGEKKIKFERLVKERGESEASILREIIGFYFKNSETQSRPVQR